MKYRVVTRTLTENIYEIEASDPKDAEYKSIYAEPLACEDIQTETMSISPVPTTGDGQ